MKISDPNHQEIVQQVGLHLNYYDDFNFKRYISYSYQDSEIEARDEVHRMHEQVVLHKESGLRVSFLTSESYDGNSVEYIVIDCFVFTLQNQKLSVSAIDLERQVFETTSGTLPFSAVRNTVDKSD